MHSNEILLHSIKLFYIITSDVRRLPGLLIIRVLENTDCRSVYWRIS